MIYDDERMRYLVLRVGWVHQKRIYLCLLHIEIVGETVIIQCNNTEEKIASELVRLGMPKDKIGLGFLPPAVRLDAEFNAEPPRKMVQRQEYRHQEQVMSPVPA